MTHFRADTSLSDRADPAVAGRGVWSWVRGHVALVTLVVVPVLVYGPFPTPLSIVALVYGLCAGGFWLIRRAEKPSETRARLAEEAITAAAVQETGGEVFYSGGTAAVPMRPGGRYWLQLSTAGFSVWSFDRQVGELLWECPWSAVTTAEVAGRGAGFTGGGFMGGGAGVEGAAEGMAVATVLNSISRRSTMDCALSVETAGRELVFDFVKEGPGAVGRWLAPWRDERRSRGAASPPTGVGSTSDDLAGDLRLLAGMRATGDLTDEEYRLAKQQLLARP